jgi:CRISPR-associated protein Cas5h
MVKILSFRVSGEFAAFRDPSVTSNQTVYYIPSKTAVVGMIGAILGIERGQGIEENYSEGYRRLYEKTRIGIECKSSPEKITFFTNHRSLKEAKTKPFKTELLSSPKYRIFVSFDDDEKTNRKISKIYDSVSAASFVYPPYLGHAYCPASLGDAAMHEATEFKGNIFKTAGVVLDESETFDKAFSLVAKPVGQTSSIIIERHLHHFVKDGRLQARVLKHWIPLASSLFEIELSNQPQLSKIFVLDSNSEIVTLY